LSVPLSPDNSHWFAPEPRIPSSCAQSPASDTFKTAGQAPSSSLLLFSPRSAFVSAIFIAFSTLSPASPSLPVSLVSSYTYINTYQPRLGGRYTGQHRTGIMASSTPTSEAVAASVSKLTIDPSKKPASGKAQKSKPKMVVVDSWGGGGGAAGAGEG